MHLVEFWGGRGQEEFEIWFRGEKKQRLFSPRKFCSFESGDGIRENL